MQSVAKQELLAHVMLTHTVACCIAKLVGGDSELNAYHAGDLGTTADNIGGDICQQRELADMCVNCKVCRLGNVHALLCR